MSCVLRRVAASGSRFVEALPDPADLADAARTLPAGGVYGAFGTWNDYRVIRLSEHFDRLEDSARRLGFDLRLDRALVRGELCEILRAAGFAGARVRLCAHPDLLTPTGEPALSVAAEPYAGPSAEVREHGVACRTVEHAARANPRAKQTSWLADRSRLDRSRAGAPYEWLLLDDGGYILEGASSNFYAIVVSGSAESPSRSRELRTAGEGVLHGIARSIVFEVARGLVALRLDAPRIGELDSFAEAFITSASRGIVPVVRIDESVIGGGVPGPLTKQLIESYDRRASELEEPLCG